MALIDNICSTDSVWRGSETERYLSDDLNAIQSGLAGKASSDHTHTGFVPTSHGQAMSEVTGLGDALEGKASSNHTHSGFAATSHNHAVSDVTGLQTASRNFEIEVQEVYT